MNKETRIFIWGLILLTFGVLFFYYDLKTFNWSIFDIVNVAIDFYFICTGINKINKVT